MAAVHITGASWPANPQSRLGPFKDSSGNLWVVAFNGSGALAAFKSTDGGASWTDTADYATSVGTGFLDCAFDGSNIYAVVAVSGNLHIARFTISSATWSAQATGGPAFNTDASGSLFPVYMALRSDGTFIVTYQGPTASVMGKTYRRVYYITNGVSAVGAWGTATELDAGSTQNYDLKSACIGASDRTHVLYTDDTVTAGSVGKLNHRSIASGLALDTAANVTTTSVTITSNDFVIFYDGTWGHVLAGIVSGSTFYASSAANPTWASMAGGLGSVVATDPLALVYDSTGSKLYAFYTISSGIEYDTASGTTWTGTPTAFESVQAPGISCGSVSGGIGVVWNQTTGTAGVYYDTFSLGPNTVTGAAALHATATSSTAGFQTVGDGAAALHATASQSASGFRTSLGVAHLAATSSITVSGTVASPTVTGAVHLSATASSSTTGFQTSTSVAHLAATSSISSAGFQTSSTSTHLSGTSSITVSGVPARIDGAHLAATGSLTSGGKQTSTDAAHLTASASLGSAGTRTVLGTAHLAGTASSSASGFQTSSTGATCHAVATLSATPAGGSTLTGAAHLASSASLHSGGFQTSTSAAHLSSAASLASGGFRTASSAAHLSCVSTLVASGLASDSDGAALTASAHLTVAGAHTALGSTNPTAAAQLAAAGFNTALAAAHLAAVGSLAVDIQTHVVVGGADLVFGGNAGSGSTRQLRFDKFSIT